MFYFEKEASNLDMKPGSELHDWVKFLLFKLT